MDIELPVVPAKKGLDPQQVNVALSDVQFEVSRLETERAEIDKRIDKLTREVAEVRSALKRASAKPSFSDLGAAFEQTLRVAEEQAGKLISDAQATSAVTRRAAEEEAVTLTENAQKQAQKLVAETEARVERLLKESEETPGHSHKFTFHIGFGSAAARRGHEDCRSHHYRGCAKASGTRIRFGSRN